MCAEVSAAKYKTLASAVVNRLASAAAPVPINSTAEQSFASY